MFFPYNNIVMSELAELFKKQRSVELGHARALRPTMNSRSSELASVLLESIIHDSRKHAAFFKTLIDIESGKVRPEMDLGEAMDASKAIEDHIKVEQEMIDFIEDLLKQPSLGGWTRAILTSMLSDERRHHNILRGMADFFTREGGADGEEYFGLDEKYMYQGPDHGHKARQLRGAG